MKITPEMNGGHLPYGKWKLPSCLKKYHAALALGSQNADGSFTCYAFTPDQKPKNPVAVFLFHPDRPGVVVVNETHSAQHLSPNTISNPLDFLHGDELTEKLVEMWQDGYAAW